MTELEQLVAWLNRIGIEYTIKRRADGCTEVFGEQGYEALGIGVIFDEHECAKVDSGQFSW